MESGFLKLLEDDIEYNRIKDESIRPLNSKHHDENMNIFSMPIPSFVLCGKHPHIINNCPNCIQGNSLKSVLAECDECSSSRVVDGLGNDCQCPGENDDIDKEFHPTTRFSRFFTFSELVGISSPLKTNDVLYIGEFERAQRNVIFFHGDCQDYPEVMLSHPVNHEFSKWNLYHVANILHHKYPNSNIILIKASRMQYGSFAVWYNFVASDVYGSPFYFCDSGAMENLFQLLTKLDSKLKKEFGIFRSLMDLPITLIGFSKGCVVLNQILYELLSLSSLSEEARTIGRRVDTIKFLDGGHSGHFDTWVTNEQVIRNVATSATIQITVDVTPYQMQDPERSWIRREKKAFVDLLRKHKARLAEKLHFEDESRSLENHFRILEVFKP